jgi:hypothetical protein
VKLELEGSFDCFIVASAAILAWGSIPKPRKRVSMLLLNKIKKDMTG